jgi:sugar (pentulose or hexulose) kinase
VLSAIAQVEAAGYATLNEMGASPLTAVATAGGGATNDAWTDMRQRKLGVPTCAAANAEAAFGLAILATWSD